MAWQKALFLGESLSMSKYDVVPKRGLCGISGTCSSWSWSSMTTHSELPVSGSSLSWKTRWVDPELMARVAVALKRVNGGRERMGIKVLGIREAMKMGSET